MEVASAGDDSDLSGASLGHYRVLSLLGRGGMGSVYAAEDRQLGRRVALKVLAARIAGDPTYHQRFAREARLLASLVHSNIATIHSLEEAGGVHFFTMELVEGVTLRERVAGATMSIDEALACGRQIARALEIAHHGGIVHRDLTPNNVKLTADGQVKVLDFGIAKGVAAPVDAAAEARPAADAEPGRDVTGAGNTLGTPGYMSPEQVRAEQVDPATDIWAFGCVLYECVVGVAAFPGSTVAERNTATLTRDPSWEALPDAASDGLRELLRSCLTRDRRERLDDATELRRWLEDLAMERTLSTAAVASPVAGPEETDPHLPRQLDSFVGRRAQTAEVQRLIASSRAVTLAGAGGCGKTRLGVEVARAVAGRFRDGVRWVELAPLVAAEQVNAAVAMALRLPEERGRPLLETLAEHVASRHMLLVLDNCEHVIAGCAELATRLLQSGAGLHLLVTSREPLLITGETIYTVPVLEIPGVGIGRAELGAVEAVRLFVERAAAAVAGFRLTDDNAAAVAHICRRLDGIPLALELAAARVRTMPVAEIAFHDDAFTLLTGGSKSAPPHHQTLRGLIDWSWDHLELAEQTLLRRLGVFAGSWSLDQVESICAGDGIDDGAIVELHSNLVDKSLVDLVPEASRRAGRARYRMMETVRQYAGDRLAASPDAAAVGARHRDHFVQLAEGAAEHLKADEQTRWFVRLTIEHENLRAAFAACAIATDPALGLRLAGALGRYWMVRGHWSEGRARCARVLEREDAGDPTLARAEALNSAGNLCFHMGDYEEAGGRHAEGLAIRRRLGDRSGEAKSLNNLGEVARLRGERELAAELYGEALEIQRELGEEWAIAVSLNNLGEVAQEAEDYARARVYHEGSLALWPEVGDRSGLAWSLSNLGFIAAAEDRLEEARDYYQRSLAASDEIGDRAGVALAQHALGDLLERQGDAIEAQSYYREGLRIRWEIGERRGLARSFEALAAFAAATGESIRAVLLLGAAEALRERLGTPPPGEASARDRRVAELRAALGEDGFTRRHADGRAMPLARAVDVALGNLDELRTELPGR